ncbi:MAG: 6-phosphofructokinase, partial [Chlamydiia bacterium]|nr:6-phosphofructokinase [Chlamydiia bacterium]
CGYPYRVVVLGHLQRGGSPTARDRILASELGDYAVTLYSQGKSGIAVGTVKGALKATPLAQIAKEKKPLNGVAYALLQKLI